MKGHQDDDCTAELDEWAQLNIAMDDGAKEHWYRCKDLRQPLPYVEGEPWPLWVAGTKVTRDVAQTITDHIDGMRVLEYWKSKDRLLEGLHAKGSSL